MSVRLQRLTTLLGVWTLPLVASGQDTIGFEPFEPYATGTGPELIELVDLDGDGILDVVLINSDADSIGGGNSISSFLGRGDGLVDAVDDFAAGNRPEGLVAGDFDRDGNPDVATANFEGENVSILLGRGNGRFDAPRNVAVAGGPRGIASADFDGDGRLDLATSNYDADTVSILRGDGAGGFTISSTIPVGREPEVVAVARVDDDSEIDLVVVNVRDDTVTPLLGDGDGGFEAQPVHVVGDLPRFVLPIDLDGDGLDDLVTADNAARTLTVARNLGGASFRNEATLSHPELIRPVVIAGADVDNDGRDDLVVNSARGDTVVVFRASPTPFVFRDEDVLFFDAGGSPVGVAAGDVDVDGFTDILTTNVLDDTLYVYRSFRGRPGVIVDNDDDGASREGSWSVSEAPQPYGRDSLMSSTGGTFRWTAELTASGEYELFLWWTSTDTRSAAVDVEVDHTGGTARLSVDQTTGTGFWHSLGTFELENLADVRLTAPSGGATSASADALRIVAIDANAAPIARIDSIAPDPSTVGELVFFRGSGSDADGSIAGFRWTSDLDGLLATTAQFSTANLSAGVHRISLVVTDDDGAGSAPAVASIEVVEPAAEPPLASAGADRTVAEGTTVVLDGSASAPAVGGVLTYLWEQVSGPGVELAEPESATTSFETPSVLSDQDLVFQLTVTEDGVSDADTVTIRVTDQSSGSAAFAVAPRPDDIVLDGERLVLGFQGSIATSNDLESEDWTSATFAVLGSSDPGQRIVVSSLYVDANGNGIFDDEDRLLDKKSFARQADSIDFDGFLETLLDGSTTDFFIVCELAPEAVMGDDGENAQAAAFPLARFRPHEALPLLVLVLSVALALATVSLRRRSDVARPSRCAWVAPALLVLSLSLPMAGCGGGGGGGGGPPASTVNDEVQLQLTTVDIVGTVSRKPTLLEGLPVTGWRI